MHEVSLHDSLTVEFNEQNFPQPPLQGKSHDKLFCIQAEI